MKYDKHTAKYFVDLPSRKRLEHDRDFLEDYSPDFLYHYSCGLFRLAIVRNFNKSGLPSSYSLMAIGYPPSVGSWRSLYNSTILEAVIHCFNAEVIKFAQDKLYVPRSNWNVSEL